MRVIDEKYRLFGIINPIDLAVMLVIILAGVFVARVVFGVGAGMNAPGIDTATVTMVAAKVRDVEKSKLEPGTTVRKKNGTPLGEIVSVRIEPALTEVPTADGRLVQARSELLSDVTIVLRSRGTQTEQGFDVDGTLVRENMEVQFSTPTFQAMGRIQDLEISR